MHADTGQKINQKIHPGGMTEPGKSISLTPYQAVTIHGWLRPSLVLQWKHVLANRALTWPFLRGLELTPEDLKKIQPDPNEWANHTPINITFCRDMACFPLNPIQHLHASIDQIIQMRWHPEELAAFGVGYRDLVRIGMTPEFMPFFGYKIVGWQLLGMTLDDVRKIPNKQLFAIFTGMTREQIHEAFRHTSEEQISQNSLLQNKDDV